MKIAGFKRTLAPLMFGDLTKLGRLYGTNKASTKQLYTPYYEQHFSGFRRKPIRLLEIGIGGYGAGPMSGGGSLRMWRSWMPRAQIVGIDLDIREFSEPRVTTFAGSQTDTSFLHWVCDRSGPFDIVIDDGSHMNDHIAVSFRTLWPLLQPGGVYVIEDLGTSYMPEFGGGPPGTAGTSVEMIKTLLDSPTQGGEVLSVHMYPHIVFIEKRQEE